MDLLATSLTTHIEAAYHTLCDTGWQATWPSLPFARLYWVVDGYGLVMDDQQTYELLPHRLTLIPGHASYHHRCPATMDIYWMHFTAYVWGSLDLFMLLGCPGVTMTVPADTAKVQHLWDKLLACWGCGNFVDMLEADGLLRLLLAQVLSATDLASTQRMSQIVRFRELLAYIDQHLTEHLTLQSLAERVNLHPTYFANLFAQCVGTGPMAYVLRQRIARAQGLLQHSTLPIEEIAIAVGYADPCYFSRIFRRHTGCCPSKYRQQRRTTMP